MRKKVYLPRHIDQELQAWKDSAIRWSHIYNKV